LVTDFLEGSALSTPPGQNHREGRSMFLWHIYT